MGSVHRSVHIVTDSSCDLSIASTDAKGITVIPLSIRFGDREYTDRTELSPPEFYALMESHDDLPETAAPAPGAFDKAFRDAAAAGADAVICITISSELSATGQSAKTAAGELTDVIAVHCLDSRSVSSGLGTLVLLAAEEAANGADAATILANTEDRIAKTHVIGALDTLENLKKGGRVGNARALVGTMLSIKPCIDISTGVVEEAGKQRTRKKALAWLKKSVLEAGDISHLAVGHAQADDIDAFIQDLATEERLGDIRLETIGPVIGTHGGPRVVGVSWIEN